MPRTPKEDQARSSRREAFLSECVTSIVDRRLELQVPVGSLCEDLSLYDSDDDAILEVTDLLKYESIVPQDGAQQLFHNFVVRAFRWNGIINEKQKKAVFNYFNLYNWINELHDVILEGSLVFGKPWKDSHIDTWGSELEFEPKYWEKSVAPVIEGGGIFSNQFGLDSYDGFLLKTSDLKLRGLGYQLSLALYNTLDDLGIVRKYEYGGGCSSQKVYNQVDIESIPPILQESAREMMNTYNEIEEFLDKYDEIECEGDGCPEEDEISLHNLVPFQEKPKGKAK